MMVGDRGVGHATAGAILILIILRLVRDLNEFGPFLRIRTSQNARLEKGLRGTAIRL